MTDGGFGAGAGQCGERLRIYSETWSCTGTRIVVGRLVLYTRLAVLARLASIRRWYFLMAATCGSRVDDRAGPMSIADEHVTHDPA